MPPLKPTSDGVISYPVVSPAVTIDEVPPRSLITRPSGYSFATHLNGKQECFYDIRGCHGQVKRVGVMDCAPTFPQARRGIPYLAAMTTFKAHRDPEPHLEMSYLPRLPRVPRVRWPVGRRLERCCCGCRRRRFCPPVFLHSWIPLRLNWI